MEKTNESPVIEDNSPKQNDLPPNSYERSLSHYANSLHTIIREDSIPIQTKPTRTITSILKSKKNSEVPEAELRRDSQGVNIHWGSKKHHISFKALISEVKEVESYKEYNKDVTSIEGCMACNIF